MDENLGAHLLNSVINIISHKFIEIRKLCFECNLTGSFGSR